MNMTWVIVGLLVAALTKQPGFIFLGLLLAVAFQKKGG